jgi:hypothetical protein
MFSSLVFKLARPPVLGAAGRSVAVLNGCSLRTGRRFVEGNYMSQGSNSGSVVTPNFAVCSTGCAWSTNNRNESTVLVGVNFRFF